MKAAFIVEEGDTITAHFGMSPEIVVVTVEDGLETGRERRPKAHHGSHNHDHDHEHGHHHHGHDDMFAPMADCDVMIVRGMGSPAFAKAQAAGLTVYMTQEKSVNEALAKLIDGTLDNDQRRIHQH